jgi:hypothetical protein
VFAGVVKVPGLVKLVTLVLIATPLAAVVCVVESLNVICVPLTVIGILLS